MKKIPVVLLLLTASLSNLFAQPALKQAIDDFHYTLAFTYHPMADDGNFTPIRQRSALLATSAAEVKRVSDSLGIKNTALAKEINRLAEQCKALDESIQNGSADDLILEKLTTIHSQFHAIEEMASDQRKE